MPRVAFLDSATTTRSDRLEPTDEMPTPIIAKSDEDIARCFGVIESFISKGHGKALIDWLRDLARERGCTHLHLDSGTQRHRAHRFYLRQGMDIASFHFSEKLDIM